MYQIDNASAATVQPARAAPGPNPGGFFTGGNPATNTPATQVDADWLDMVQNELAAVLSAAGVAQAKANDAQLLASIQAIVMGGVGATYVLDTSAVANAVVLAFTPAITAYKDGQVVAGKIANSVTAPATLDAGAGAVSFVTPVGPFQGGELPAGSEFSARYVAASNKFVLLNSTAGALAVNPGTQSNHAVNLGQFGASIGSSGYQLQPTGYLRQWGNVTLGAGVYSATATLPIAFQSSAEGASAHDIGSGANSGGANATTTQINVYKPSGVSGAVTYYWEAWGK